MTVASLPWPQTSATVVPEDGSQATSGVAAEGTTQGTTASAAVPLADQPEPPVSVAAHGQRSVRPKRRSGRKCTETSDDWRALAPFLHRKRGRS